MSRWIPTYPTARKSFFLILSVLFFLLFYLFLIFCILFTVSFLLICICCKFDDLLYFRTVLNLVYGGDPGVVGQADKKVQVFI